MTEPERPDRQPRDEPRPPAHESSVSGERPSERGSVPPAQKSFSSLRAMMLPSRPPGSPDAPGADGPRGPSSQVAAKRGILPAAQRVRAMVQAVTTDPSVPAGPPPVGSSEPLWSGRIRPGEEVGRGAMGYVIRGNDTKLRRDLALKVSPLPRDQLSREQLARFVEEAQVTAQLEHPNVVPVHDIGVDPEGRVYFSMKLIRGQSLEAIFDERRAGDGETRSEFGLRRLLDVFLQVCQGVEYAHARGVIHRDLKPANIMVGDYGEVLVMDWGVAKLKDRIEPPRVSREAPGSATTTARPSARPGPSSEPKVDVSPPARDSYLPPAMSDVTSVRAGKEGLATQFGTVIGTPAYMSPEQAQGLGVDEKTDIYALGVILYEMLCGTVPFEHDDPVVILGRLCTEPPLPPSQVNPAAPLPLESLVLRMLAKTPAERSLTMGQIRGHVQDYIEGVGRDYRPESLGTNVVWFGGALAAFAFVVWYLTGQSIAVVLALAPPAVFNAFGWFLLVLSVRYPLWAAYVAFSQSRTEHDRFRDPTTEELFVSGYMAHRTFAATLAPVFQLIFVVELVSIAVKQATENAVGSGVLVEQMMEHLRAGWANALISILVFLFTYLMFLSAEVRFARRTDRYVLFVERPAWESTWPFFLIFILLLSITATGLMDWIVAKQSFDPLGFFWERVLKEPLNPFEILKTLVFQGTFLLGLVGGTLLLSFPFAELLASLRLPYQAADAASVASRQQYFLRSTAFFRIARASWLYGGAMIGCLTAITMLSERVRHPLAEQVLYISGPSVIGFAGYWFTRRYFLAHLSLAPAVLRMLEERAAAARLEQERADRAQVSGARWQQRLAEVAVPVICVVAYLLWTGSRVDERAVRELVLPVSTKGWLLILPYVLLLPVLLGRDGVRSWFARRRSAP